MKISQSTSQQANRIRMKIYIRNGRSVEDREGKTLEPGIQVKTDERDCLGKLTLVIPEEAI
jgi:hypothetical protein